MNKSIQIQELAIAITAKNLNPSVINLDFLKYSSIISSDWELARQPVYTKTMTQLVFQNGIAIVAQPNRIVFAEAVDTKDIQEIQISQLAAKCIEKLSNVDYQAVGINPKGFVTFAEPNGATNYLLNNLLASGEWKEFAPVRAAIQLAYNLGSSQFNLTINEGLLKVSEENSVAAMLFSGNFNYNIFGEKQEERLQNLYQILQDWKSNVETYQQLINDKFLSSGDEGKTLIPFGVPISPSV